VLGGSGLIGSKLVTLLRQEDQDVVTASHSSGLNTVTGEGLDAALVGAQVVVDVTNSPSFEDKAVWDFFQNSVRHIVAAEVKAGVAHHARCRSLALTASRKAATCTRKRRRNT
jgi:uncharacterized protein YbjT (DUF2867 family)